MPILLLKLVVFGAAIFLVARPKKAAPTVAKGSAVSATPVVGQVWDMTVPDPFLGGETRAPAVPLTKGGEITGWYSPFDRRFIAIANSRTRVVVGLIPTPNFPSFLPA